MLPERIDYHPVGPTVYNRHYELMHGSVAVKKSAQGLWW